jgi:tRNA(fMet)-specific endonuclease VapC
VTPVKYLLDTDMLSFIAREASAPLMERVHTVAQSDLAISVVTRGEAEFGLAARPPKRVTLDRMRALLHMLPTLALSETAVPHYVALRRKLERSGTPIGANDMWIAAHALSDGMTLVTNNEREFRRVPGLQIENWLR